MTAHHDTEPSSEPTLPLNGGDLVAGKYRVDRLIGMGGMAAVFAGTHVELEQPIAIKVLLPERAGQGDAVRRFLTEARAAAKLKSDHVARISDVGTTPTPGGTVVPYIAMELLEGQDLATVLTERGRLPVDEAVDCILQACDAVAEAHGLGIVHRDLKPANLFLTRTRDGKPIVKLLDFGISKITQKVPRPSDRSITGDRETMGSPGYMSPEQVTAAKDVDHRTDIWSLGVVLSELVTGKDTFEGESVPEIFVQILHSAPRPLEKVLPDAPAALCDVVSRCLQKDPDRRFQSIEELVLFLRAITATEPKNRPTAQAKKKRGAIIAAFALGGVMLVGGALIFSTTRSAPTTTTEATKDPSNVPVTAAALPTPATTTSTTAAESSADAVDFDLPATTPASGTTPPTRRVNARSPKSKPASPSGSGTMRRTDW